MSVACIIFPRIKFGVLLVVLILSCIIFSNVGLARVTIADDFFSRYETESPLPIKLEKRQTAGKCSGKDFKCDNDECITSTNVCDGIANCKDGSDETENLCSKRSCPKYAFRCSYGACVDGNARCNNITECADGSDEKCGVGDNIKPVVTSSNCKDEEFQCKTGQCISQYSICDGVLDCNDKSDETEEVCGSIKCQTFRCNYGGCVNRNARCNGTVECPDGSDESPSICPKPRPTPGISTPSITTTTTTTTRRVPTPTPPTGLLVRTKGSCRIPSNENGRRIQVRCSEDAQDAVCSAASGMYVPSTTFIMVNCESGYTLDDDDYEHSICFNEQWNPRPPSCTKLCPKLKIEDYMKLECSHNGIDIDCSSAMLPSTRVFAECKYPYVKVENYLSYRYINCEANGEWDAKLFTCAPGCGKPYIATQTMIVDGKVANISDSPWNIGIYDHSRQDQLICGGTIISPYLIISAAHCFYDESKQSIKSADNYQIVVAKFTRDYDKKDNPYQKLYEIKNIYGHKDYIGALSNHANDIALLETSIKIQLSALVLPACINWQSRHAQNDLIIGTPGKVVGWGLTGSGQASDMLLAATLPYIPYKQCVRNTPSIYRNVINPDKFCAGTEIGPAVRQGDSGAGLLFRNDKDVYTVYGVVSWRIAALNTSVAMFTDIYHHIEWINDVKSTVDKRLIWDMSTLNQKSR